MGFWRPRASASRPLTQWSLLLGILAERDGLAGRSVGRFGAAAAGLRIG
jgi:hypothetical protein